MGQFKWDHKILCLSSFTTLHILSEIESHVTSFSQFTLVSWFVVVMHLLFPLCSHYFLICPCLLPLFWFSFGHCIVWVWTVSLLLKLTFWLYLPACCVLCLGPFLFNLGTYIVGPAMSWRLVQGVPWDHKGCVSPVLLILPVSTTFPFHEAPAFL